MNEEDLCDFNNGHIFPWWNQSLPTSPEVYDLLRSIVSSQTMKFFLFPGKIPFESKKLASHNSDLLHKTQCQADKVQPDPLDLEQTQWEPPTVLLSTVTLLITKLFLEFCEFDRKTEGTARH